MSPMQKDYLFLKKVCQSHILQFTVTLTKCKLTNQGIYSVLYENSIYTAPGF